MSSYLTVLYQGLKYRLTGLIIWVIVWTGLAAFYATFFDSFQSQTDKFQELISAYNSELLSAFNIGEDFLKTVEGFLGSEFATFLVLAGSVYAVIMGVGVIGGKIQNKTFGQLALKEYSRVGLYLIKALENVVYILVSTSLIWLITFGSYHWLTKQESISGTFFTNIAIGMIILHVFWAVVGQLMGVILSSSRAQQVGIGLAAILWFLNSIHTIKNYPELLAKANPYYYFDLGELSKTFELRGGDVLVLVVLSLIGILAGSLVFRNKDIQM